jgi:hypothetical protein
MPLSIEACPQVIQLQTPKTADSIVVSLRKLYNRLLSPALSSTGGEGED